jgi:DNA polymerase delta subunit 1
VLVFQVTDIVELKATSQGGGSVLGLYGATAEGRSVALRVNGFRNYFYVRLRPGEDAESFGTAVRESTGSNVLPADPGTRSLWGYRAPDEKSDVFVRVYPSGAETKKLLEGEGYDFFEADVNLLMRFMVDRGLVGGGWVEVPHAKLAATRGRTTCTLEGEAHFEAVVCHPPEGIFSHIAPLRILSFDLEVEGRPGIFPEAGHDPIIQISSVLSIHGSSEPIVKMVMVLGTCPPVPGGFVQTFCTEKDLLLAWKDFVAVVDPDVFTGYNITGFDFPYLLDRATALNLQDFKFLGRERRIETTAKKSNFSSNAFGKASNYNIEAHGRVVLDVLQVRSLLPFYSPLWAA